MDHWKQVAYPYGWMVNQESSWATEQLTNPFPLFGHQKNVPRVRSSDFILGASPLEKMSSAKCQRKNINHTHKADPFYPKYVLDSSSLWVSKEFRQKNRRNLWNPQWLQRNEFSPLEIPFGVPLVLNLGLKLPKPLLIAATSLKNIFEGMSF